MTQITRTIDPITTEIIRNFFISCAQDMNVTLIRSAYTPIIYEGKDCSVALLDENGAVLGQSSGLPLFLGNLEICVKLTMEMFGRQESSLPSSGASAWLASRLHARTG